MFEFSPIYITFGLYLLVVIGISIAAYSSTKNYHDFILGGRSMSGFVTAMSAGASDMSGWLLMGLPGAIFISGLSEAWIAVGLIIGSTLNWYVIAGRLRIHTEYQHNALTIPDYFEHRFSDKGKLLKITSALIILLFFSVYCASGIVASARLFQSLFEIDYVTAMLIGSVTTIAYTFIGGFLAVSWADTVQATLMFFALLLTPIMVYLSIDSDIHSTFQYINQTRNIDVTSMLNGISLISIISAVSWGLGYFGQPHILTKFMAANNLSAMKSARKIGMFWMIICLLGAILVGFFGIAYFAVYPENAQLMQDNNERVFIALTMLLFNPWIAGIILSAVLAAIMSTLSAQLLLCSSSITEDLYKGFIRKGAKEQELIWVGRFMILAVAIVSIIIALNPESKILGLVAYAWAGFGAAFGPIIILSIFYRNLTSVGSIYGMIVGAATVVIFPLFNTNLYEIVPGFFACFLTAYVVSLCTKTNADSVARFDMASARYLHIEQNNATET